MEAITMTTHTYTAADELDRRAANRKMHAAGLKKTPAPNTPVGRRLVAMSAAELRTEAGIVKPARKPARTAERSPEDRAATEARKAAWAWRAAEFAEGRKHTYAEACAKFGTVPARKS